MTHISSSYIRYKVLDEVVRNIHHHSNSDRHVMIDRHHYRRCCTVQLILRRRRKNTKLTIIFSKNGKL